MTKRPVLWVALCVLIIIGALLPHPAECVWRRRHFRRTYPSSISSSSAPTTTPPPPPSPPSVPLETTKRRLQDAIRSLSPPQHPPPGSGRGGTRAAPVYNMATVKLGAGVAAVPAVGGGGGGGRSVEAGLPPGALGPSDKDKAGGASVPAPTTTTTPAGPSPSPSASEWDDDDSNSKIGVGIIVDPSLDPLSSSSARH
jgi:hypothetical protein